MNIISIMAMAFVSCRESACCFSSQTFVKLVRDVVKVIYNVMYKDMRIGRIRKRARVAESNDSSRESQEDPPFVCEMFSPRETSSARTPRQSTNASSQNDPVEAQLLIFHNDLLEAALTLVALVTRSVSGVSRPGGKETPCERSTRRDTLS